MLIDCPECKQQVSDQAEACPHCGRPMKSSGRSAHQAAAEPKAKVRPSLKWGCLGTIIGFVVLGVIGALIPKSPEERAQEKTYPDLGRPIYTKIAAPACPQETDLAALNALIRDSVATHNYDVANQFLREKDCILMPAGERATLLTTDGVIDVYFKIALARQDAGSTVLWSRGFDFETS